MAQNCKQRQQVMPEWKLYETEVALPATSALVCLAQQSKPKEPSLLYADLASTLKVHILIFHFQHKIYSTGGRN